MPEPFEDVFDWLDYGKARGWCSDVVCSTHDGLPSTPEEQTEWDLGGDPCVPGVRLYRD